MRLLVISVLGAASLFSAVRRATAQSAVADTNLRFDARGWTGNPPGTFVFDSTTVHADRVSARLERKAGSPGAFSVMTQRIPIEFGGRTIELRGFLRTEGVTGWAGIWLREDGSNGMLQFDNMQSRALSGTTDWTEYTIRLPLDAGASDLMLGVLMEGEGRVWADGLRLFVDGKPVSEAPRRVRVTTVLDTDREFTSGSRIDVASLSPTQTENLSVLGRVWGFLKYHHPAVAEGKVQWDFELFRVLPAVLAASDRVAGNRALAEWVAKVGLPARCTRCATAPDDAPLRLDLAWIRDTGLLGAELSRQLQAVHANRFAGDEQFFVQKARGVGNPVFSRELPYQSLRPTDSTRSVDAGYRMLALFRFWNIIEYWFPYRDIIGEDWRQVLRDVLPRFVAATTWDAYRLEMIALIARVHDTHANLWSDLDVRPPRGTCAWPVTVRFVEDRAVVAAFSDTAAGPASGFQIGDVIEAIGGMRVDSLVTSWLPYYAASNRPTQLRDVARTLPRGECAPGAVTVSRGGRSLTMDVTRTPPARAASGTHDLSGPTYRRLSPDVAYLKLSSVKVADVADYINRAAGTRGMIIDIRNYPSEFVVFALGQHLVDKPTPFARFTQGDLANPGTFTWTEPVVIQPKAPRYRGKIVILVDEVSQSQAEYTTMAFRAATGATVIGSTTAGADGNVSAIPLPGGLRSMISGIGVFYPDKKPTQRVGIIPDIVVMPTLNGIRDGRDEVLDAAIRRIMGPGT